MTHRLLKALEEDLTLHAPYLALGDRESVTEQMLSQLLGRWGLAEYRLDDQKRISWLFDRRSGQLLSTYPGGASRVRSVATPMERS